VQFAPQPDLYSEFFAEFPVKCGLRLLARFNFSAREFPETGELLGGAAPGHQNRGGICQGVQHSSANYV
jgi:hypothetical protein